MVQIISDRDPKFTTASGELTRYSLACGYVEKFALANCRAWVELSLDGCLHVRLWDSAGDKVGHWTGSDMKTARKIFSRGKAIVRRLAAGDSVLAAGRLEDNDAS